MHLLNPEALWLVLAVPLAGVALWLAWRRHEKLFNDFGDRNLLGPLSELVPSGRFLTKAVLIMLGLAFLVVAISRPSISDGKAEFPHGSIDVIAIVDVSRSMAVPDYKGKLDGTDFAEGRRLDMARHLIADDLIPSLNYNRLGVVTYSGSAFPMAFLSDDMLAMDWVLKRALVMGSAPGEGSEMDKAFEMAFTLFDLDSSPDHRKIVVLFSDGGNDAEVAEMHEIMAELEKRGVELIVVGLGNPVAAPIPVNLLSKSDQSRYYGKDNYEHEGQVVTSKLEENWLLLMRNVTGGRYVRVVDPSDFSIGTLVSRAEVTYKPGEQELFFWPLIASTLLLMASLFVPRAVRTQSMPAYRYQPSSKKRRHRRR